MRAARFNRYGIITRRTRLMTRYWWRCYEQRQADKVFYRMTYDHTYGLWTDGHRIYMRGAL